jgi:CubicO group peptidase (beta-lactamase class C family)
LLATLAFVNPHRGSEWSYRRVPAADPRPHAVAERPLDLAEFHAATATTAFQVQVDGVLVHAWYADGLGPRDLFLGASATKSVLAHLVGRAGLDLDAPVDAYVPELPGYRRVSVRDLARMTSGVDWVEDHRDPHGPATALVGAFAAGGSSRALLTRVGVRYPPGTRYAYCTADSQVLDWVRERATGVAFPDALAQLWRDLGCTEDAMVAVDGDGVALAGGGVAAAAGDWARVGSLQIDGTAPGGCGSRGTDGGRSGGAPPLDPAWIETSSRPSLPFLRPGRLPPPLSAHVGFGYHWWPLDEDGARVAADGSRGQFVYVDRPRRTVVVKTSAWAYADPRRDAQCRDLTYRTLPAIAASTATQGEVVQR